MVRLACLALLAVVAAPGRAQDAPIRTFGPTMWEISAEYRSAQRGALEAQRRLLLAMADSMPEQLYRDRTDPYQSDFAQQLYHVISTNVSFTVAYSAPPPERPAPAEPDTAAVLNSRAALREYIISSYDWLIWVLDHQGRDVRNTALEFLGPRRMPRWQVWDELNQHALWTLGQVVGNFRKNGLSPPTFIAF